MVLDGHDHFYERHTPQDPDGIVDLDHGIREFIIGTGGKSLSNFTTPPIASTEVRQNADFGVLFLRLRPDSYDWDFIPVAGGVFADPGSALCVDPQNAAPSVTINAPASGSSFTADDSIVFDGSATDTEDGDVTASLTWSSDLDGVIGTGGLLSTSTLSVATHTVTATATDGQGLAGAQMVVVTVDPSAGNGPPIVSAGTDITVTIGGGATMSGSGSDDGLPDPPGGLTFSWTQTGGSGVASFAAPTSPVSNVTFSQIGTYTLTLTAFDGEVGDQDTVVVTVGSGGGVETVELRVSTSFDDVEEKTTGKVNNNSSSDLELVFDVSDQVIGLRYPDLPILNAATITNAYIQFTVDEATSGATSLEIRAHAVDDAAVFSTVDFDVTSRPTTAAAVSWDPVPWSSVAAAGQDQRTPDLSALIQVVIDLPGWIPGNALVLIVSGTGERVAEAYDGDPGSAALLHVEFTTSAPPGGMSGAFIGPL